MSKFNKRIGALLTVVLSLGVNFKSMADDKVSVTATKPVEENDEQVIETDYETYLSGKSVWGAKWRLPNGLLTQRVGRPLKNRVNSDIESKVPVWPIVEIIKKAKSDNVSVFYYPKKEDQAYSFLIFKYKDGAIKRIYCYMGDNAVDGVQPNECMALGAREFPKKDYDLQSYYYTDTLKFLGVDEATEDIKNWMEENKIEENVFVTEEELIQKERNVKILRTSIVGVTAILGLPWMWYTKSSEDGMSAELLDF